MRPWYRIHRSTWGVVVLVVATIVFINIPGDRALRDDRRFHHGWPYLYYEREAEARSYWSFVGTAPKLHAGALALNAVVAFCIAALAACACELWIRRYGRLFRFSITSMLVVTTLLAVVMGLIVQDLHRCSRQQQTLNELAKLGSMRALREERRYDWLRSLFGSDFDGSVRRIDIVSFAPNGDGLPDLAALEDLRFLSLEGVALGPTDVKYLESAPKLESLFLTLPFLRVEPAATLKQITQNPALVGLTLNGDSFDDNSLSQLSANTGIKNLAIKSARVTSHGFQHLSKLQALETLWIEGVPLRDADFGLLARFPKLKNAIFVGCNLSQADEQDLLKLWPDGNVHTGIGPDGKSKLVQAFRMHVDPGADAP